MNAHEAEDLINTSSELSCINTVFTVAENQHADARTHMQTQAVTVQLSHSAAHCTNQGV